MTPVWSEHPELPFDENVYPAELYRGSPPSVPSDTSEAAAESVKESSGKQRNRVRHAFFMAPPVREDGWTDDELEQLLHLPHQSLSARRRELVLLGEVVDSGRRRKTRSGRSATVWVVAP